VAEHKEIEDLIDEIAELDAGSKTWSEKFAELKHEYLHHIEEEEEEMFPAADEELTNTQERDMGAVFKDRKPKEKAAATVGEE
jgi:hemerythrin-like domain-containing protein